MPAKILVIDDEESMCRFMEIMLSKEGYQVDTANDGMSGVDLLKHASYDLVIADLNMPEMTGIELLKEVKTFRNNQDFIVMTAYATVDTAIEAMKQGAVDYITKPFKVDEIKLAIEKSISRKNLIEENKKLKKQLNETNEFECIIGKSNQICEVKKLASRIASSDSTVLIRGESGTGKDLMAKAIHNCSPRQSGPFITINCGALPESLLESELFGHKKGSFTGAIKDKDGLFKVADGGTFFLDEIGNTSPAIQIKLLRVLEEKRITPIGDTGPIDVDVRLIAATNSDLEKDVKQGRFREDLFYRLNVIPLHIPALRDRKDDIPLLIDHFMKKFCNKINVSPKAISKEAIEQLMEFPWKGNVRELENTIERAVLLSRNEILDLNDFPKDLSFSDKIVTVGDKEQENPTLESIEKAYIHFIISKTGGKKAPAAKILGIDQSTLYRKIERYELENDKENNKNTEN